MAEPSSSASAGDCKFPKKVWVPIFARCAAYTKAHLYAFPKKYSTQAALEPRLGGLLYNFGIRDAAPKKGETTPRIRLFSRSKEPKAFAQSWSPLKERPFHRLNRNPI